MPHIPTHLLRESGEEFKLGDSGFDVESLQIQLANAGFSPGTPDGIYGRDTAEAHQKFRAALAKEAITADDDVAGAPPTKSFIEQLAGVGTPISTDLGGGFEGRGLTPPQITPQAAPPTPSTPTLGGEQSLVERLGATLSDPSVQKFLLSIGGAISSADPSKAPGFGARLNEAITPIIDAGIEQEKETKKSALEERRVTLEEQKVQAGIAQGEEGLKLKAIGLGISASSTQAQVDLIEAKIQEIKDAPTFEERSNFER